MSQNNPFWEKCRTCGKTIGFSSKYWTCSVSSCNRKSNPLIFCSVDCWEIHAPVMNHKNAGADENFSPPRGNPQTVLIRKEGSKEVTTVKVPQSHPQSQSHHNRPEKEILIVASKLKQYIKDRSDMNTAASVMDRLSDLVRDLCDQAIDHARQEGRKTVMDRDFL